MMNCLAVLHPRRFVIASVKLSSYGFKAIHTHEFQRNLFNFCLGSFGQKTPMACIQSVDGAIFFV